MRNTIQRITLGVLVAAVTFSFATRSVYADTSTSSTVYYDENFYSLNNIGWYDPRCAAGEGDNKLVSLAGNDNTEKILNFFMRKGLNLAQATGIVGNMMQESGLNPAIIQGGGIAGADYTPVSGTGFGLIQWTSGGRQQNLVKYAKEHGGNVTDLTVQLGFTWQEMNSSYPNTVRALKAATNPVDAAVAVHGPPDPGYEASADSPEKVRSVRGGNAQTVYDKYKDAPALAGSTADSSMDPSSSGTDSSTTSSSDDSCADSGSSADTSTFTSTVKSYAWPDYKGSGYTKQTDAYSAAVKKASSEGRYIGGAGGDDCGGFVTTLMVDSGFDKTYNSNGKGGNTISQEAWLKKNWKQIKASDPKQPGDVAINEDHTYVYVGTIAGFNSKIASASLPDRSPMAGKESDSDPSFRWYRKG